MKKNLLIILIPLFSYLFCCPQTNNEATILYLLPFHSDDTSVKNTYKSRSEIHQVKPFEMMGFWLGAKMALQEYEYSNKIVNVIVRDAVTNIYDLNIILEDSILMKKVNIIIGPFYASLFPHAAEFAKNHKIWIINPFSSRYDFVENNPYVFKLTPPFISRPEVIAEHFLSNTDKYDIILWGDSLVNPELLSFRYFFNEHHIPFSEVQTLDASHISKNKNITIPFFVQRERVIYAVHKLINYNIDQSNRVVVVPEEWLSFSELTEDFYNLPDLYYFTNYFVDENNTELKQFQTDYIYNYEVPAELADYSYQGYDVTRYFIDLFFADFNEEEVFFKPLSYKFNWKQLLNGGFENIKTRFIQVKDLELKEVK